MKKKLLFFIMLGAIQASPFTAHALPYQTLPQLKAWVKQHKFLPPNLIEDTSYPGAYWVERKLQNGKSIRFYAWIENNKVIGEELYIISPESDTTEKLNLFDRQNASTQLLIKTIYGDAILKDFQQSKLIYKGFNYYSYDVHTNERKRLIPPTRNDLFQGKTYAYSSAFLKVENTWVFSITSKTSLKTSIVSLEREKALFLKETKVEAQKKELDRQKKQEEELLRRRTLPAELDI